MEQNGVMELPAQHAAMAAAAWAESVLPEAPAPVYNTPAMPLVQPTAKEIAMQSPVELVEPLDFDAFLNDFEPLIDDTLPGATQGEAIPSVDGTGFDNIDINQPMQQLTPAQLQQLEAEIFSPELDALIDDVLVDNNVDAPQYYATQGVQGVQQAAYGQAALPGPVVQFDMFNTVGNGFVNFGNYQAEQPYAALMYYSGAQMGNEHFPALLEPLYQPAMPNAIGNGLDNFGYHQAEQYVPVQGPQEAGDADRSVSKGRPPKVALPTAAAVSHCAESLRPHMAWVEGMILEKGWQTANLTAAMKSLIATMHSLGDEKGALRRLTRRATSNLSNNGKRAEKKMAARAAAARA